MKINPTVKTILQWVSIALGVYAALSFFVMLCWNLSMPTLGLPALSYRAAVGLVGLVATALGLWYAVCKEQ